jgi:Leucine-rich repeat (LRR) protein
VVAFQQLQTHLKDWPLWTRIALVAALPAAVLVLHTIPALIEQSRKKRLSEITGNLRSGYFRLVPREDQADFSRADGKHEEVLEWLARPASPLLYLTGQSGSGKSSLLAAWVIPHLVRQGVRVIRLRGYQDPLSTLERELQKPGVIWQKSLPDPGDLRSLLERSCRYLRPERLLVVLDQFEEFVILQDTYRQRQFEQFLLSLRQSPIPDLVFLFVLRSDYIGLVEKLSLPPLAQETNWKEIPPFTEKAASEFMHASGLQVSDKLLRDVLREAAEIEQTKGLVRPVTINLCGLVLGRFAHGLPRGFRHGGLIRAFLNESILLPSVRDVAPRLVPHLITNYVTKQPRSIDELAKSTGFDATAVRGCLRVLGQRERAIVRPLDADQQTWEISHDFLVPLLDSIAARWSVSMWRKSRPWLPWIGAAVMVVAAVGMSNWRKDPIAELTELGWTTTKTDKGYSLSSYSGVANKESVAALQRLHGTLNIRFAGAIDDGVDWNLPNLTTLDLHSGKVSSLEPLRNLTNLSRLDSSQTAVSNCETLKGLKNLSDLSLAYTKVSNLEPLRGLTNLSTLSLGRTRVGDLAPLAGLTNLSSLSLVGTAVRSLDPLRGLINLDDLELSDTGVSDLEPLRNLTNLSSLSLDNTPVSNLEPLRSLTNLSSLSLDNTPVSNLDPLRSLTNLSSLRLDNTPVSNLEPLRNLPNLTVLYLIGTHVSNAAVIDLQKAHPKWRIFHGQL